MNEQKNEQYGYYDSVLIEQSNLMQEKIKKRSEIRAKITQLADDKTIIGVLSDVAAVSVFAQTFLIKAISECESLEDLKQKINPLKDTANTIQTAIAEAKLVFPYMVKDNGYSGVMQDMMKLCNGVTNVFKPAED